jgi:hypothetical protein
MDPGQLKDDPDSDATQAPMTPTPCPRAPEHAELPFDAARFRSKNPSCRE